MDLPLHGKVAKAYKYAKNAHKGQKCDAGREYFLHCYQVARILCEVTDDEDVLCAGLLHDTIEDTEVTYQDLLDNFGKRVADLVHEVTHEGSKNNYGYYFPRLQTREAILIKFADNMSNLCRMETWDEERVNHHLKTSVFWRTKGPGEENGH